MRICHIIESANAGSSRVVVNLASGGVAAGHDITVVYGPGRVEDVFLDDLSRLGGVRLVATSMHREVGPHDLIEAWKLLKILRRHGPFDIIHSHSSKAGGLARLAGLFLPRTPQVYTPHGFVTLDPAAPRIYRWIEKTLSYFCDAIVVGSDQERRHAIDHLHIAPERVRLIRNGVSAGPDASRDAIRAALEVSDDHFVIGFVGRLAEVKNPLRALEAFALVARRAPKAILVLIGAGPLAGALQAAARGAGLELRVKLLGYVQAREYMPGFDCLLCSSNHESFGLVFPEALLAGVPVVTTPVGIVPELSSRQNGVVFAASEFSAEALAAGLRYLQRRSPEERAELRPAARECGKPYSAERMYQLTEELYRSMRPTAGHAPPESLTVNAPRAVI